MYSRAGTFSEWAIPGVRGIGAGGLGHNDDQDFDSAETKADGNHAIMSGQQPPEAPK